MVGFLEKAVKAAQAGLIVTPVAKTKRPDARSVKHVEDKVVKREQDIHIVGQRHLIAELQNVLVKNQKLEKKDKQ